MLRNPIIRKMAARTRNNAPVSPLRYPGAKRWMSGYVSRSIVHNDMYPELFIEPFAGGASVSLALLNMGLVESVGLVDRDPMVAAFWRVLFFDTDWLVDQIEKTDVTLEKWLRLKKQSFRTERQLAFQCLYLNRTSFSGILAPHAGPIGGKSQTSRYKIDCRFNKKTIISRIRRVAQFRERVAFVWNLHWKTAVGKVLHMQQKGSLPGATLFYFDPPFYKKADSLYTYYFKHDDHLALRDYLVEFSQPWILSYDLCPEIIGMYKDGGLRACDVNLIYTASHRRERGLGKEVIVSNLPSMVSELQLGVGKSTTSPSRLSEKFHARNVSDECKVAAQTKPLRRRMS